MYELLVAPTPHEAAAAAAHRTAVAIEEARRARGVAHLSLAGGSTPRVMYELLAPLLVHPEGLHLWFGDERAVPPDDEESNFRMVSESLLAVAEISAERVHRILGERPAPEAAEIYADELGRAVARNADGVPVLDLAFLGLGEDGHTASLFPGDPMIGVPGSLVRAVSAPKPPPDRVTLTLDVLRAARRVIVLATGGGKREAVCAVLRGPDPAVPASLLPSAVTTLIVDAAAAPRV